MSSNLTEEASKLRSNAASLIIQNTLALRQIEKYVDNFKISSNNSSDLSDNELKQIVSMRDSLSELLKQLISNTQSVGAAIAASGTMANIANDITNTAALLNDMSNIMSDVQYNLSLYQEKDDFPTQKQLLQDTHGKIILSKDKSGQTISGLMSLLFR